MKFTVHERRLREQLGGSYNLSNYTEGVDYRRQKTGFGSRVMFRADIIATSDLKNPQVEPESNLSHDHVAITVVDPSLVEHKQDKTPVMILRSALDGAVRSAKVVKKHFNQRYVETDTQGRVFVGEKGHQIKVNQLICVRNGNLFLGKTEELLNH